MNIPKKINTDKFGEFVIPEINIEHGWLFLYHSVGSDWILPVESDTLNEALIFFATNYHSID